MHRLMAFIVGLDRLKAPRECSRHKTEAAPAFLYVDSMADSTLVPGIGSKRGKRLYENILRYVLQEGGSEGRRREGGPGGVKKKHTHLSE